MLEIKFTSCNVTEVQNLVSARALDMLVHFAATWQVFYVSTRPRNEHRGGLYEECAYCELSVLIIHCWNYTFQPCRIDKVQTTYNYLDLGVGLGQLPYF